MHAYPLTLDILNHVGTITSHPCCLQTMVTGQGQSFTAGYHLDYLCVSVSFHYQCRGSQEVAHSSRATAADAERLEFLETVASTFILASPAGGLIHRGGKPIWMFCID